MKKISFMICLVALLMVFPFANKASAQKPIELSYSIFFPSPHKQTLLATEWAKEIEKRTNGRVKITLFPGGTLTPADKCYQGVITEISDIGLSATGYTRGRFPFFEIYDLPLGMRSGMICTKLLNELYKKFQPKELDDTKPLYFSSPGPSMLHTKKPVRNLEDLKGLKIRSAGAMTKIIAQMGAAPVAMPPGEVYDALSKGVVEGILMPTEVLEGWKFAEVVKYTTECYGIGSFAGAFYITMNKDKWKGLSPEIQKIIETVNEEWIEKTGKLWDELDQSGKKFALKSGHMFISLSKEEDERWAKLLKPLFDDYINNMKVKGLPGEEALKFCMEYLKKNQ
jgi:TRAP-type C4-dicarboxylate transport system substrate-binding protein